MKILITIIILFTFFFRSCTEPTSGIQATKKECYWKRGYTIWAVPCGYAFMITEADELNPPIYSYGTTYIEAKKQIDTIYDYDKIKGLVICK